ncbi:MAG: nitrophenyl compound nitroreductase subunit ArsF family protein [candidate division Zixibacteria bacterium]|nr:nitrophenyl compound nitroreductase subunit ArsF family protein [candidate division Zixibacteria bacterium]
MKKKSSLLSNVDSLFVIHFHPTVQCSCCINVGNFAKKGLEKYYAKPYKEGRIVFREYNIDEDSSTAKKYKIFWSALGFEKFSGGKNEFKEIESVWEFCEDEKKFLVNFKKELDNFMLGDKKSKPQTKTQDQKRK